MLSNMSLVALAGPKRVARRGVSACARLRHLLEALEPRRLLASAPVELLFTDDDGDSCVIAVHDWVNSASISQTSQAGDPLEFDVNAGGGPNARLVVALRNDNGGTGDNRPTLAGFRTNGIRIIDAPTADFDETDLELHGLVRQITIGNTDGGGVSIIPGVTRHRTNFSGLSIFGTDIITPGIFTSFTCTELFFSSSISAGSIVDMRVNNTGLQAANFDLNTTDLGAEFAVKSLTVTGEVFGGDWDLNGKVQSIRVGNTQASGSGQFFVDVAGRLGTFAVTAGSNWARITVGSAGVISASSIFFGDLTSTGVVDSLRAVQCLGADLSALRFGQMVFGSMTDCDIDCQSIGTLTVVGSGAATGYIDECEFNITGTGLALGTMTVSDNFQVGYMRIAGNAGAIKLGGFLSASIYVGVQNSVATGTLVSNTNQFVGGNTGRVESFRIGAKSGDPTNWSSANFAARSIGTVTTTAKFSAAAGSPYGLSFETITSSVSLRRPGLSTITSVNQASFNVGDFNYVNI